MHRYLLFACLAILLVLAGCSGDSSDDGGSNDTNNNNNSNSNNSSLKDWEEEMLDAINDQRKAGATCGSTDMPPVGKLKWDDDLAKAAKVYARDMEDNGAWNHIGSDGSTPSERVTDTGYSWSAVGENIARGQTAVDQVMADWMASDGHCANIMSDSYTEVGLARIGDSWVQVFGRPQAVPKGDG